jgi:hypothetical protein
LAGLGEMPPDASPDRSAGMAGGNPLQGKQPQHIEI